jgi:hypothetical protein
MLALDSNYYTIALYLCRVTVQRFPSKDCQNTSILVASYIQDKKTINQ